MNTHQIESMINTYLMNSQYDSDAFESGLCAAFAWSLARLVSEWTYHDVELNQWDEFSAMCTQYAVDLSQVDEIYSALKELCSFFSTPREFN